MPIILAEPNIPTNYTLSDINFVQNISLSPETGARGIFFKTDGTRMYVQGLAFDRIRQYDLSVAWDISTAVEVGHAVTGTNFENVYIKPDGTKFWDHNTTDDIYQYSMSTPWDITTETPINNKDHVSNNAIAFSPDGTKFYLATTHPAAQLYEYDLSVAWDTNTSSLVQTADWVPPHVGAQGLVFNPNGTGLIISNTDLLYEFSLSTPWDISTWAFVQSVDLGAINLGKIYMSPDGTKLYAIVLTGGVSADQLYEYNLT